MKTARAELLATLPDPTPTEDGTDPREAVFGQLLATDANTVAVASHEWAKVEKLLAVGRDLGQLIRTADRRRLAAILDQFPTSKVAIDTGDTDAVVAEVQGLAFDRLVQLGDPEAQKAAQQSKVQAHTDAWHRVLREAAEGEVSVVTQSALHRVAPDEFQATVGSPEEEVETQAKLRNLERFSADQKENANADH